MQAVETLALSVGIKPACEALGISRATLYRKRRARKIEKAPKPSARALNTEEREQVLGTLHSDRFIDKAPQEVYATLLDEGKYLCSIRTMYRILEENGEVKERRDQLAHPAYKKPELLATAPNQVWSWDITKLLGPVKWSYYYLYVILDIFSRYVVGWLVSDRESASLAQSLIEQTCLKQCILPGQLTIHADRGSSISSKPVAFLLLRSWHHQDPQQATYQQRQSILRSPVQNTQVPARLPGPILLRRRGQDFLSLLFPLVQPGSPPQRHQPAHSGDAPLRGGRAGHQSQRASSPQGLRGPSRAFRQGHSIARSSPPSRLDQSAIGRR